MRTSCAIILCLGMCGVAAAQAPSASRILKNLDFEERTLGNPEELPMHWTKVRGPGMPHYVNGQLASDRARSGKYSFRLDLNGGSLIYRYDAGQIKVHSRAHYRVETYVQTTVLTHARARLSAYFVDLDGRPIAGSVRRSELYSATKDDDPWKHLELELTADAKADSLVIELALLQPAQYEENPLGEGALFSQDIRGTAWFDDVVVSQVPQVTMSTDRPGNIFRKGQTLRLQVLVWRPSLSSFSAPGQWTGHQIGGSGSTSR